MHPDGRLQRLRPAIGRPRGAGRPRPAPACGRCGRSSPTCAKRSATSTGDFRTGAQVSRAAVRGRPVLRRAHARGDRRPRRALGRARGVRLARLGGRDARASRRPPRRRPTASCGSAPTARCGRPRRSTSRPRCTSSAPARSPSSRRPTPPRSGINEGDRVEVGNGTRVRAQRQAARGDPRRQRVPRRGHARGQRQRAHARRWSRSTRVGSGLARAERRRPRRSSPPSRAWPRCRPPPACRSRRGRSPDGASPRSATTSRGGCRS